MSNKFMLTAVDYERRHDQTPVIVGFHSYEAAMNTAKWLDRQGMSVLVVGDDTREDDVGRQFYPERE